MDEINGEMGDIFAKLLNAPRNNLLRDVMNYNDSMTISQVVKFFERQGAELTKPMIQHYVRVGLLPPPEDKRRYTRFHLLLLAMVEQFKGIYALDEIASAFSGLNPSERLIGLFQDMSGYAVDLWRATLNGVAEKAQETAAELGPEGQGAREAFEAFMLLGIMSQSAAARKSVSALISGVEE